MFRDKLRVDEKRKTTLDKFQRKKRQDFVCLLIIVSFLEKPVKKTQEMDFLIELGDLFFFFSYKENSVFISPVLVSLAFKVLNYLQAFL